MVAEQFFGVIVFFVVLLMLGLLIRHRLAFARWLVNDRKEIKARKKWARRAVEDAQDDLDRIEEEEREADAKAKEAP